MLEKENPQGQLGEREERGGINPQDKLQTVYNRAPDFAIQPGYLLERVYTPSRSDSLSPSQEWRLVGYRRILSASGLHAYFDRLGFPPFIPIYRLSKRQAWLAINTISNDLEAAAND